MMQRRQIGKWLAATALALLAVVWAGGSVFAQAEETDTEAEPGVLIVAVAPDSPAAAAGLSRGDILLRFGGEPVNDAASLAAAILAAGPDATVEITFLHGDDERTVEATLDEQAGRAFLGVRPYVDVAEMDAYMPAPPVGTYWVGPGKGAMAMGTTEKLTGGALILEVIEDSPADAAGLKAGDVITGVNGVALDMETGLADHIGELEPGAEVTLDVRRGGLKGEAEQVVVTLAAHPDDEERPYLGVRYAPLGVSFTVETAPDEFPALPMMPYFAPHKGWVMPYPGYGYGPHGYGYPALPCPCGPMHMPHYFPRGYHFMPPEDVTPPYGFYYGPEMSLEIAPEAETGEGAFWFYSPPDATEMVAPQPDVLMWQSMPATGAESGVRVFQVTPGAAAELEL